MPHHEYSQSNEAGDPALFQAALDAQRLATDFVEFLGPGAEITEADVSRIVDEALSQENIVMTELRAQPEPQPHVEIPVEPEARQRRVAEILSCSPDFKAEKQQELNTLIDQAVLHAPSEHDRRAVELTGGLYRWKLFGKYGDPLPEGFVITKHPHTDSTYISCDNRKYFGEGCVRTATEQLNMRGLEGVLAEVIIHSKEKATASPEIAAIFNDNPANAFLRSFDVPAQPKITDMPLDQRQRAIEEEKIRQTVFQRHGLDSAQTSHVRRGDPVDTELRRGYWRLDDQTQQQQEPQVHDGLAKLRAYLVERTADVYLGHKRNNSPALDRATIESALNDTAGDVVANIPIKSELSYYLNDIQRGIIEELGGDKERDHLQYELMQQTIQTTLNNLFYEEKWYENLSDFMNTVEQEVVTRTLNHTCHDFGRLVYDVTTGHSPNLRDAIVTPEGEFVPYDDLRGHRHNHGSDFTGYASKDNIERSEAETVGVVQRGIIPNQRIIRTTMRDDSLPRMSHETELEIKLFGREFDNADPEIPGYTLVSHDAFYYGFKRDATDPYALANVPIPDDKRVSLAKEFQDIGLETLAQSVESQPMTIEELRANIQQQSHYPKPDDNDVGGIRKYPIMMATDEIKRFEQVVFDGQLHVQCTGAAEFLRLSLNHIFENSANVTNGISIDGDPYINAAGHRQTTFVHDGRSYILDATPGARPLLSNTRPAPDAVRATQDTPPTLPEGPIVSYQDVSRSRQENLQHARSSLESQLSSILQTPNKQTMYSQVAVLPEATDPVRRTLSLAMRACSDGAVSKAEATALVEFLDTYKERTSEELHRFGLPEYDNRMLDMLSSSARTIAGNVSA